MTGTTANYACSILKYFGQAHPNESLSALDSLLKTKRNNIINILLDGMGSHNMKDHLSYCGFFEHNKRADYSSVFPPTTVAATASMECGLYPSQHGRLGWTMYYPKLNQNVLVYSNLLKDKSPAAPFHAAETYTPYKKIVDILNQNGIEAHALSPYGVPKYDSFSDMLDRILELTKESSPKYIYAYWPEPDSIMHKKGVLCDEVKNNMLYLENALLEFSKKISNSWLLITADHGHIDAEGILLTDYPDILNCLERLPSIEQRALNLFAKEGKKEELKRAFTEHFGDNHRLYTRQEALDTELFGIKPYHEDLATFLGDYIAVAKTPITIFNNENQMSALKGVHAGATLKEKIVPLIAVDCP